MPLSCPVCGKEVQPTTMYCPACGTNLRQDSTIPGSSPLPQQQAPSQQEYYASSYRAQPQSESRSKRGGGRVWAIIAALLLGLFIGGVIGYEIPAGVDYTTVTGQVNIRFSGVAPHLVFFNSTTYGNLTGAIQTNGSYLVNLPTGDTYHISIEWYNMTGPTSSFGFCKPSPSSFLSNQASQIENLSC